MSRAHLCQLNTSNWSAISCAGLHSHYVTYVIFPGALTSIRGEAAMVTNAAGVLQVGRCLGRHIVRSFLLACYMHFVTVIMSTVIILHMLFFCRCTDFDPWRGSYCDQCCWGSPSWKVPKEAHCPKSSSCLLHACYNSHCVMLFCRCADFDPWRGSYGDQCRWGSPSWKVPWEAWGVDDTKLFRWPGRGVWALTGRCDNFFEGYTAFGWVLVCELLVSRKKNLRLLLGFSF
jgi:hypothetical protein